MYVLWPEPSGTGLGIRRRTVLTSLLNSHHISTKIQDIEKGAKRVVESGRNFRVDKYGELWFERCCGKALAQDRDKVWRTQRWLKPFVATKLDNNTKPVIKSSPNPSSPIHHINCYIPQCWLWASLPGRFRSRARIRRLSSTIMQS